jgi:hypothetical protein
VVLQRVTIEQSKNPLTDLCGRKDTRLSFYKPFIQLPHHISQCGGFQYTKSMNIVLKKQGNYIKFYRDWFWFYEVKYHPIVSPGLDHLREKEWFTHEFEFELLDLISIE